jgi:hypothetical protein
MPKLVSRYWLYATVILGLVIPSQWWERRKMLAELRGLYQYRYRIYVIDADTGLPLNPVITHPTNSTNDLFFQGTGSTAYPDHSVAIYGVAYTPRTFRFTLSGYKSTTLTVGPDNPDTDEIRIRLQPLTSRGREADGQQAASSDGDKPPD